MTYHTRLYSLQKTLQNKGCDALLIDNVVNLFYLTGLELSSGWLLVHSKGADLCVDGRYLESAKKHSPFPVRLLSDPQSIGPILDLPEFSFIKKIGFDSDKTAYNTYERLKSIGEEPVRKERGLEWIPIDSPLRLQRAIKDADEIQVLRDAAVLGSQGFDFLCGFLKEGLSEEECAVELEIFWKKKGSKSLAFDPIIAFGANSSMPHHRAGKDILKHGQIVLIDIGVNLRHYHSDMTRVVFFGKQENTHLLAIHSIVQKAQQAALALCRPGTTFSELDIAARSVIAEHGYAEQFTHNLGHGIGLDIHEYPSLKNTPSNAQASLKKGMAITIEPGIYLPGIGGIRIEDSIVITEDGYENLTLRSTAPLFI